MKQQVPDGQRWGKWVFEKDPNVLIRREDGRNIYEIDLGTCTNQIEVLDWIVHISDKVPYAEADIGHLVRALEFCLAIRGLPRTPEEEPKPN